MALIVALELGLNRGQHASTSTHMTIYDDMVVDHISLGLNYLDVLEELKYIEK